MSEKQDENNETRPTLSDSRDRPLRDYDRFFGQPDALASARMRERFERYLQSAETSPAGSETPPPATDSTNAERPALEQPLGRMRRRSKVVAAAALITTGLALTTLFARIDCTSAEVEPAHEPSLVCEDLPEAEARACRAASQGEHGEHAKEPESEATGDAQAEVEGVDAEREPAGLLPSRTDELERH